LHVITDALGERTQFSYDANGRLLNSQLPDGRTEQYQRDASGQLVGYTDPAGHTTLYQHNRRGQVRQRTDAHGRQVQLGYDSYGRLQALTNENGERYRFAWDAGDRLTEQQDLDGSAKRYDYDRLDNITAVTAAAAPYGNGLAIVPEDPPAPIIHRLERDAVGRLIAKTTDDGRTHYSYDAVDQLTAVTFTDLQGNTQALCFAYDALGQLLAEQSSAGTLHHHYDELGNLIQTQLPDGRWLNRLYYGSGHLHQINLDGHVISDFERDRLHREVLRTQGQLSTRSEYDRSGRLRARQRRHASQPSLMPAAAQKHFEYDPANNLISRREDEHLELLHYDATGRIIATQDNTQGQRETFAYDAAANLLDGPQPGAGLVVHNKLLTYQDKRYRYDAFGRMIEKRSAKRGVQRFAYDAESRLIEVRNENGSVLRMTYDPLGRRIEKTEHGRDGYPLGETRFMWDGLRLLQEHMDRETGLHFNTFRFYDPDVGRFTTPDPIGLTGGINLYKYAQNPISWIDPWGLLNLNTNGAAGNFGVYEIRIDGELYKYGKADMNRVTESSGNPTRLHQQVEKLERLNPGKTIKGTVLESGISTTQAAKTIETAKLDAHYKKLAD